MAGLDNNTTSKFLACIKAKRLESFVDDKSLLPVYASSTAKVYPYQIAAARFALRSDYLKGCILCDEASLGKTYEALLVAGQMWYEGKENILIVVPAILLSQWLKKLISEFTIPYVFWNNTKKLPEENGIVITTYDIAERHYQTIKEREWDLVIFDEADVLSNFNKESVKNLKSVLGSAFKLLLTPTPITKDIRDIYGLIHFIDESVLPDIDWYYKRYYKHPERFSELDWISRYCFRTLKRQTTEYVNFSERIPLTIGYPLIQEEKDLYNPIVIIDEPQSVDNTPKSKEAIQSLNPMCVLRYSATHREKINLLYRLTPVDAYQKGLVKQIVVTSCAVANDFNKPYIYLKSVSNDNGFKAKIEIDILGKNGSIERKTITVKPNDDLFALSGNRELYDGYKIEGIDCTKDYECIEFSNSEELKLGKTIGGIDENIIKRNQIYKTIEAHLNKELRYFEKGIKVLSLFFIDEVKKYRTETGEKGIYAQMFEECYTELMSKEKYAPLKNYFNTDVEKAHNGYFSQDKKGIYKNTKGDTQADDDTYNTIMKDKEWLLSFDCPLRFIFSHSALKEGWDNPNVFQVCTLIEQKSTFTCRQKVGRGLRLCVNQDGERIEDREINLLHVIANESFSEFASTLQKEIEEETGMKFGILQLKALIDESYEEEIEIEHIIDEDKAFDTFIELGGFLDNDGKLLENKKVEDIQLTKISEPLKEKVITKLKNNESVTLDNLKQIKCVEKRIEQKSFSHKEAEEIIEELIEKNYITKDGKIKDTMKAQLAAGKLDLKTRRSKAAERAIMQAAMKADNKPIIRDGSKEVMVKLKKQAILSSEFKQLWDKIKQKTTYQINIDTETLVKNCVKELQDMPPIPKAKLVTRFADLNIDDSGIDTVEKHMQSKEVENTYSYLPDILRLLANETQLLYSVIARILIESGRDQDFVNNPQLFYEKSLEIIQKNCNELAIDGIKYVKLAGEEYYVQEIFDSSELLANLDKNALQVEHSVYDYLIYDSGVESRFAKSLDNDPDVKMFFKIPKRFKIDTPIGSYNPDWAVFLEQNGEQKLYFVLETKGTNTLFELRTPEKLKIHCGNEHFKALEDNIQFYQEPVRDWNEFKINL